MKGFKKDPDAVLDYTVDWSDWLGTDTINSATFTVETGLTKDSESNDTTTATVYLSGGTVDQEYEVTCHIVTVGGLEDDRTFAIKIVEK